MFEEPEYDENLWFKTDKCCSARHYLTHNPHAFIGALGGWCPNERKYLVLAKSDIKECSHEATYWIKGFLHGNEPDAPRDNEGSYLSDESNRFKAWLEAKIQFIESGEWKI